MNLAMCEHKRMTESPNSPATQTRRGLSLLGWIVIGYLALCLPLFLAVGLGQLSLLELTQHSQALVQEGSQVTQLGGELRDNVTNLERIARQYVALGEEDLLTLFYQRVAQVDKTLSQMHALGLHKDFGFNLVKLREQLAQLVQQWNDGLQSGHELSQAIAGVQALAEQADDLVNRGHASIERETAALQKASKRARERMLACALGLVPLALLAGWMMIRRLRLTMRSLRRAIAVLGTGDHSRSLAIDGPREMQELGQRLEWLRKRLLELESDKEHFLRHVSHELKTPLASAREAADLLGNQRVGELNPQQQELRDIVLESVSELHQQIGQLLAYAAWRREQTHQDWQAVDMQALMSNLRQRFELPMAAKQLQFQTQADLPQVVAQPRRLREALENLVSNAIKYSPPGQAIELGVQHQDKNFAVWVRDHGAGVPDNEKLSIFEPFVRGDNVVQQGISGTGVGLSIVSECALAHQGEVFVEDAQPGSRFVFRWPDQS